MITHDSMTFWVICFHCRLCCQLAQVHPGPKVLSLQCQNQHILGALSSKVQTASCMAKRANLAATLSSSLQLLWWYTSHYLLWVWIQQVASFYILHLFNRHIGQWYWSSHLTLERKQMSLVLKISDTSFTVIFAAVFLLFKPRRWLNLYPSFYNWFLSSGTVLLLHRK